MSYLSKGLPNEVLLCYRVSKSRSCYREEIYSRICQSLWNTVPYDLPLSIIQVIQEVEVIRLCPVLDHECPDSSLIFFSSSFS